jgi:Tfp pilus assembly protein PilP
VKRSKVGTKNTVNIILSLVVACVALVLFCAVSDGETGKTEVFKIPKEEKAAIKPIQETKQPEPQPQKTEPTAEKETEETPYSYDPTNKVDPFKSFITIREELEEKEAREKPRTYLETLDLSQLTISAIILAGAEHWALVRDSKGDGHVIKVGTPIGRRGGRVTEILEDKVVVRESVRDIRGREITRDTVLKLPVLE